MTLLEIASKANEQFNTKILKYDTEIYSNKL